MDQTKALAIISEAAGTKAELFDRLDSFGMDSLDFLDVMIQLNIDAQEFKGETVGDLVNAAC